MKLVSSDDQSPWRRQRRAHRKSRQGCRNCKLWRVKCDETKPECVKCRSYGVVCYYDVVPSPDLQLTQELKMPPLVATDGISTCELDKQCLARLERFRGRSITTVINVPPQPLLQPAMGPYLMHATLAFTEIHDRYLNRQRPTAPGTRELYHATATFLGILAVKSVPATTTEDCWPLKQVEPSWLCLNLTKTALWKLTNPLRPESLFHDMSEQYRLMYAPRPNESDVRGCLRDPRPLSILSGDEALLGLYRLCGLQSSLNSSLAPLVDMNPYREAFKFLHRLSVECVDICLAQSHALVFISRMQPCFVQWLRARDPVALLLLALWYERAGRFIWWIRYRALVEDPAICSICGVLPGTTRRCGGFLRRSGTGCLRRRTNTLLPGF
ncbi:Zn(II)2Cys6 transcription factor domain-containing protein [Aspergillus affinis]|uniref:Zn(II)2Cys6 transcription factor domain-containing protein n=1 Tax=Aspergillus affinis TaxID=1070780 RepID=UPI0022FDF54E|nr:uncharacterized protein KD926_007397 [Aspergillus affinis]KAI9041127.1 hypothetical protein KD926_007397 [Aspergillus affinis]